LINAIFNGIAVLYQFQRLVPNKIRIVGKNLDRKRDLLNGTKLITDMIVGTFGK
jgi:hypothetical protein